MNEEKTAWQAGRCPGIKFKTFFGEIETYIELHGAGLLIETTDSKNKTENHCLFSMGQTVDLMNFFQTNHEFLEYFEVHRAEQVVAPEQNRPAQ